MPPNRYRQTPPKNEDGPQSVEELAEELGIDPSVLEGGAADPYAIFTGGLNPNDPVGDRYIPPSPATPQTRPARPGFTGDDSRTPTESGGGLLDFEWVRELAFGDGVGEEGGLKYATVGELLKRFYQLDPNHIRRIQAMLYAGGFFGNVDVTDIRWGEHDEASFSAWAGLIERTAKLNAAGKDITFSDVMAEAATAAGIDLEVLGDLMEEGDEDALEQYLDQAAGEGDLIQITLSDPNGLRATMDQAASAVLGRRATPEEQQLLISTIHGIQRSGQLAMQGKGGTYSGQLEGDLSGSTDVAGALGFDDSFPNGGDTIVEYAPPDEGATAEALLRQQNPAEAGAHDVANQVANLLQLLDAPVDVPSITVG